MAGKIQKPYELLQFKRGKRRRPSIVLPELPLTEPDLSRRAEAIELATKSIERQFGAGRIAREPRPPVGERKRRYVPKAERKPNAQRAEVAAARPRDAQGHFLKRERPTPTKNADHYGQSPSLRGQGQASAQTARDDDRPPPGDAA